MACFVLFVFCFVFCFVFFCFFVFCFVLLCLFCFVCFVVFVLFVLFCLFCLVCLFVYKPRPLAKGVAGRQWRIHGKNKDCVAIPVGDVTSHLGFFFLFLFV